MKDAIPDTRKSLILRLPDKQDIEAWERFVAIYEPVVFRLARATGLQDADANDLVQEVMIAVARAVERWEPGAERGRFRDWLFRISRNLIINFLSRPKHRPWSQGGSDQVRLLNEQCDPAGDVSDAFDLEFRREVFRCAAERVQKDVQQKTWDAFQLTSIDGRTVEDVAGALGMNAGAVQVARCRVLRDFGKRLDIWNAGKRGSQTRSFGIQGERNEAMIPQSQHADEGQLQMLLFGDESSGELAGISSHVESCGTCQLRLQRLAASDEEDQEVRMLLSRAEPPEIASLSRVTFAAPAGVVRDHDVREYLDPPSHPEMLGRLGRYEIECEIGAGGMGVVFKGFDSELNRPVAIKVLARHLARSGAARQRFGRESRAAAAVVHEHVVAIHNVESNGEMPFLVMQFVPGESLQARVDRVGRLSVPEVLRIGIQAAGGLAAAHEQGIVHRDIKPANILLEHGVERVLLTDFGLARTVDDASLTQTGIVAGTPHYMSPEQANGDATDHRTDLFSLGSVLYFVATGHPPFRAERAMGVLHRICHDQQRPVWQVNPDVPDELSDIIDRLLEKRPARRFGSATAVREALVRLLSNLQQRRPSIRSRVRSWRRRHGRWIAVGLTAGIALALVAAAAPLLQPTRHDEQQPAPTTGPTNQTGFPSADLLAEIAPAERSDFDRKLDQIREQLRPLEAIQLSEPGQPLSDGSQTETQSILQRLDRLQIVTTESQLP